MLEWRIWKAVHFNLAYRLDYKWGPKKGIYIEWKGEDLSYRVGYLKSAFINLSYRYLFSIRAGASGEGRWQLVCFKI